VIRTLAVLLILALPCIAHARDGGATYPKLAAYTSRLNEMLPAQRADLARYDLLVHLWTIRPEMLSEMRRYNPRLRVMHQIQPQYAQRVESENPWWLADTLWSPARKAQWYAYRNDWYLKQTNGQRIDAGGDDFILNWTPYCPRGRYGASKGLRLAQWYPQMLAEICLSGRPWPAMDWDRTDGLRMNGVVFEILADCLGSYGHLKQLANADPNRDGRPEGVWSSCSVGGSTQPLSNLMRMENAVFWSYLRSLFPQEAVLLVNENSDHIGPVWRTYLSGMKLENWDPNDWRRWWYGLDGRGYLWAERRMGRSAGLPDRLKGWDVSILRLAWDVNRTEADNAKRLRFALGTALLGDGFFYLSPGDDRMALWREELGIDLGIPTGDCRAVAIGADTLWSRAFSKGRVVVNTGTRTRAAVGPMDARFTIW